MRWCVIGSSPSVTESVARIDLGSVRTITTNAGLKLLKPDVYFLRDRTNCRLYVEHAMRDGRAGTRLVTLKRPQQSLLQRGLQDFHEFVDIDAEGMEEFVLSGLFCVEYACRRGATNVALVGMDGYKAEKTHFDKQGHCRLVTKNADVIQPRMQLLCEKYPGVQFVLHGDPTFEVTAGNWEVR